MKDYIEEMIVAAVALVSGFWAVFNKAMSTYKEIDSRLDQVEKTAVTHEELQEVLRIMEQRQEKKLDRLDEKLDKVLMHVVSKND